MLRTPFCDRFGVDLPIMQAGMGIYKGLVTTPELVAAVSNAGGYGCLGASGVTPDQLRAAIRKIRTLTTRPFGVDLIIPAKLSTRVGTRREIREDIKKKYPAHWQLVQDLFKQEGLDGDHIIDFEYSLTEEMTTAQAKVIFEERVPLFVVALGDPGAFVQLARQSGTKLAGLAGSVGNAKRQIEAEVDLIIAQGTEAGGHIGSVATLPLVPQVVDIAGDTPVAAAGGIADGRGVAAALTLGAQATWCGTVFLFSDEANLHPVHREQVNRGRSEDFVSSRVFTGKTSRTFSNAVHKVWAGAGIEPLPMPHQKVLMEDFLDAARKAGRLDIVGNPCGQVAGMLRGSRPAAQIVKQMAVEAETALRRASQFLN
jgi:NAD(P)H-dependent flavin oxidoreductase YrpB (nitropropane dioxygenase family)